MLQQTFKELNSVFSRAQSSASSSQHLAITRVKTAFKDEPGEGSGVARSFYTAFSEAALANEKLPSLDWLVAPWNHSNSTNSEEDEEEAPIPSPPQEVRLHIYSLQEDNSSGPTIAPSHSHFDFGRRIP